MGDVAEKDVALSIRIQKKTEATVQGLTGKQATALLALASGKLKKDAAEVAGVHPQAVSEWLKQPHFRQTLDSIRGELIEKAAADLRTLTTDSLTALGEAVRGDQPALRLKASMYVLDRLLALPAPSGNELEIDADTGEDATRVLRSLGVGV